MSVGKRIEDTIEKMQKGDPEAALFQICSAVEATAVAEAGKRGKLAFKQFLKANAILITRVAFGGPAVENLHLGYSHPDVPADSQGCCRIEDIYYHAVRCGLYHEAKLPANLKFEMKPEIRFDNATLYLPGSLIYGLITAVVVSKANVNERVADTYGINLPTVSVPINCMWGRRQEFEWLLDVSFHVARMQAAAVPQAP